MTRGRLLLVYCLAIFYHHKLSMRVRPIDAYQTMSSSWHITKTEKHWFNELSMSKHYERIIFPYIEEREEN